VLLAIIRRTWGNEDPPEYARKSAVISSREIARMTGLHDRDVRKELAWLRSHRFIARKRVGQGFEYGPRKNPDEWICEVRAPVPAGTRAQGVDAQGVDAPPGARANARSSARTYATPPNQSGEKEKEKQSTHSRAAGGRPVPLGELISEVTSL
jgi:hypothetical protein